MLEVKATFPGRLCLCFSLFPFRLFFCFGAASAYLTGVPYACKGVGVLRQTKENHGEGLSFFRVGFRLGDEFVQFPEFFVFRFYYFWDIGVR